MKDTETFPNGGRTAHDLRALGACALLAAAVFATGCEAYDDMDGFEHEAPLLDEDLAAEGLADVAALEAEEEMGVAMLMGDRCNAVFDYVNRSSPLPLTVTYAYHEDTSYGGVPNIMQGHLGGYSITNGVRGSGPNVDEQGFSNIQAVQFDLKKLFIGFNHYGSTVRLRASSAVGIAIDTSFAPTSCQDHGSHATLYGDSADGSHIILTYKRTAFAG